jgi:putative transposase
LATNFYMANTYTQLYIQFIFAVQDRKCVIRPDWEIELYKYITGIAQNHKHKMIAINGMPDHLHVFLGLDPKESPSNCMKFIKQSSSEWINKKQLTSSKFSWQEGFGAFSYGRSQIDAVYKYIEKQKVHHQKKSFINEYKEFLKAYDINFDDKYLFKEI